VDEGIFQWGHTAVWRKRQQRRRSPSTTFETVMRAAETKELISKGRLDALTDGVFAFAMTLLVVKVDLPEDFHPTSAAELVSALLGLGGTFIAYVVTFLVLATFWLGRARTKEEPGEQRLRLVGALPPVSRHPHALLDDGCWPLRACAGDMRLWSQHSPPSLDGNRHYARDRARYRAPADPKRPSRTGRADRFGYSLDGNRLLQPR